MFLITTMHCFRVFVNRSLMLEKVGFFGFDMDYTLAGQCTVVVAATLMALTLYAGAAGCSFVSYSGGDIETPLLLSLKTRVTLTQSPPPPPPPHTHTHQIFFFLLLLPLQHRPEVTPVLLTGR